MRRSRKTRRLHLAGRGRDARSRNLLRLSQIASSCDKQRPQQYSSQQAHESAHPRPGVCLRELQLGIQTDAKTRSHYKLAERICCASSAHRISTHDSSLRMRSRAHSGEPRCNSLERGEIVTAPRGVPPCNASIQSHAGKGRHAAPAKRTPRTPSERRLRTGAPLFARGQSDRPPDMPTS